MDQPKDEINRLALSVAVAIGVANFIAFFIISLFIGGDANNSKIENGRYFLRNHAIYTEVSDTVFIYSLWHARSILITQPLAMLAAYLLYKAKLADAGGVASIGFAERCGRICARTLRTFRRLMWRQR